MIHTPALCLIAGMQSIAAPAAIGHSAPTLNVAVRRVELTVSVTDRKTHQPVRDLNSLYAIEFAPAKIDGKWHNISVQLLPRAGLRPGQYKIRARKRYFAEKSDSAAPARPEARQ